MERTLILIKPEAYAAGKTAKILDMFLERGFAVVAAKTVRLTKQEAERFYSVHIGKEFYDKLTTFMSTGPILTVVMEKEDAIVDARELMGPTDPAEAPPGSIRSLYGTNVRLNSVHGSDSTESAGKEIRFFFSDLELLR